MGNTCRDCFSPCKLVLLLLIKTIIINRMNILRIKKQLWSTFPLALEGFWHSPDAMGRSCRSVVPRTLGNAHFAGSGQKPVCKVVPQCCAAACTSDIPLLSLTRRSVREKPSNSLKHCRRIAVIFVWWFKHLWYRKFSAIFLNNYFSTCVHTLFSITLPITSDYLVMSLNTHFKITVKVCNTIQNNMICKIDS